jgi:hypothetical protein
LDLVGGGRGDGEAVGGGAIGVDRGGRHGSGRSGEGIYENTRRRYHVEKDRATGRFVLIMYVYIYRVQSVAFGHACACANGLAL